MMSHPLLYNGRSVRISGVLTAISVGLWNPGCRGPGPLKFCGEVAGRRECALGYRKVEESATFRRGGPCRETFGNRDFVFERGFRPLDDVRSGRLVLAKRSGLAALCGANAGISALARPAAELRPSKVCGRWRPPGAEIGQKL